MTPNATQNFTLTVNPAPAITGATSTTFTTGTAGSFTMTATGCPDPEVHRTPVTLHRRRRPSTSAGVLSGTPAAGTGGTYPITVTAINSCFEALTQSFTLTVS